MLSWIVTWRVAQNLFKEYDVDNSGSIDKAEFIQMVGAIEGSVETRKIDELWIEMNEAEGDEGDDGDEAMNVVSTGDAFAVVCHRHRIYVPHDFVYKKTG